LRGSPPYFRGKLSENAKSLVMGEAAKRKALQEKWRSGLIPEERIVVDVAAALLPILPDAGACYRMSLFLKYYLQHRHNLQGEAIIGYVNDGTDQLYSSHAWFTFRSRVTDLAISRPLHPDLQKAGPLVIHGQEIRTGWRWTYHKTRPPEGEIQTRQLLLDPSVGRQMREAEDLHQAMAATAKNDDLIRAYLDRAPDGLTYEIIAARLLRTSDGQR
jgi:hypothetical protein